MHISLWLPVAAAFLGLVLYSLSADGGASLLDHFGIQARMPKWLLPVLVMTTGIGAGVVDGLLAGKDLEHAAATALLSALTALAGAVAHHAVTTGKDAGPAVLLLLAGGFFAGCDPALFHKIETIAADVATCLVAHQDMPDEQALLMCGVTEAEKIVATELLHEARRQSAQRMAEAAERAARAGACGHRDGGAR